jgi:XRE family transcriptional regulator, aerobic/anaerobic benzoate catabolism transcriptional regulator
MEIIGDKVRSLRQVKGISRRKLAEVSEVSERYLALLESGRCNPTVQILSLIAPHLEMSVGDLVDERQEMSEEYLNIRKVLRTANLSTLRFLKQQLDVKETELHKRKHIALIGLRGAGKSTVGEKLASHLKVPFIELGKKIEQIAGMETSEIFSLRGQANYHRVENEALEECLKNDVRSVIAIGGSLVLRPDSYELLLRKCETIWLKASPEEHMERVIKQGDSRPMSSSLNAMTDLKNILNSRLELYQKADYVVNTSEMTVDQTVDFLSIKQSVVPQKEKTNE